MRQRIIGLLGLATRGDVAMPFDAATDKPGHSERRRRRARGPPALADPLTDDRRRARRLGTSART
jgi:hypothetical protein